MIRIQHEHSKIVYCTFCFKIIQRMAEEINTRRLFTKEFKLKVVQSFCNHDKNCNQTATHTLKWIENK